MGSMHQFIQTGGVILAGCLASLYILLIYELPINNLLNLSLIVNSKNVEKVDTNPIPRNDETDRGIENRSYMHDHRHSLPSPTSIISKF